MTSVSYPNELGIVDARAKEHHKKAQEVGATVVQRVLALLLVDAKDELGAVLGPTAAAFVIGEENRVMSPSQEPLRGSDEPSEPGPLPQRGFQARWESLNQARQDELGTCKASLSSCKLSAAEYKELQELYERLHGYPEAGAEALLGLARLHRRRGDLQLAAHRYRELARSFADRLDETYISYGFLADVGIADVSETTEPVLRLLRRLLARYYDAPEPLLTLVAERSIARLRAAELDPTTAAELDELEAGLDAARREAAFSKELSRRVLELRRVARVVPVGMPAPWDEAKTLVFRELSNKDLSGYQVENEALASIARQAAQEAGLHAALDVVLRRTHEDPSDGERAHVALGPLLPHLTLALVAQTSASRAMDDIAEARRRHRGITGGLVALLVVSLVATIRGAARARELAQQKSDFVSTVSHELKTPLTAIRMFAEMLREGVAGDDKERQANYQDIIVKESERLGLLIANLLDYSQIERRTRQYASKMEDPVALAREAQETFIRLAKEGQSAPLVEVGDGLKGLAVCCDREVVIQCLLNLLSNASKYGGTKPIRLRVKADEDGKTVSLSVKDYGPGIPASEQPLVFREFYRSPDVVSSAIEGTGLGLALVKRHVEAQGGSVHLSSALGKGAMFTLRLPTSKT